MREAKGTRVSPAERRLPHRPLPGPPCAAAAPAADLLARRRRRHRRDRHAAMATRLRQPALPRRQRRGLLHDRRPRRPPAVLHQHARRHPRATRPQQRGGELNNPTERNGGSGWKTKQSSPTCAPYGSNAAWPPPPRKCGRPSLAEPQAAAAICVPMGPCREVGEPSPRRRRRAGLPRRQCAATLPSPAWSPPGTPGQPGASPTPGPAHATKVAKDELTFGTDRPPA